MASESTGVHTRVQSAQHRRFTLELHKPLPTLVSLHRYWIACFRAMGTARKLGQPGAYPRKTHRYQRRDSRRCTQPCKALNPTDSPFTRAPLRDTELHHWNKEACLAVASPPHGQTYEKRVWNGANQLTRKPSLHTKRKCCEERLW